MTTSPPDGFKRLPDGVRCKCMHLWQNEEGFWCCGGEPGSVTHPLDLLFPPPPRDLDGKLEPEAKDGCASLSEAATVSIAVSLKRIADVLAGTDTALNIADVLYEVFRR